MSVIKKSMRKIALNNARTKNHNYLTKRLTLSKARAAGKLASKDAMEVVGYIVVAQNNSIIRKYQDGRTEIIINLQ